jgi:hypothetical protein
LVALEALFKHPPRPHKNRDNFGDQMALSLVGSRVWGVVAKQYQKMVVARLNQYGAWRFVDGTSQSHWNWSCSPVSEAVDQLS